MTLIEDIEIQSFTLVEQSVAPATPASGRQVAYLRTSDGHMVRKDSTATITDMEAGGGGGGGSGAQEQIFRAVATADHTDNPTPSTFTLLDGLTITTDASATARIAMVQTDVHFVAGHPNRFALYLDGAQIYPESGIGFLSTDNVFNNGGHMFLSTVLAIPGDSATHTIALYYDADSSTSTTVLKRRHLIARLIPTTPDPYVVAA